MQTKVHVFNVLMLKTVLKWDWPYKLEVYLHVLCLTQPMCYDSEPKSATCV